MASVASERNIHGESTAEDLVKEEVFKQTYIPQRLDEVSTSDLLITSIGTRTLFYQITH